MTVHVVVPVFNRLALTKRLIACLRRQAVNAPMRIWIVNDGSTDGSGEWLAAQRDVDVVLGDGYLFWGGAVDLGLRHVRAKAATGDWVLLMNNDTIMEDDFVQRLLDAAQVHAPAAVGSVIRDAADNSRLLSIGATVNPWRMIVRDILKCEIIDPDVPILEVDVLSGRGVLFPMAALVAAGGMRPRILPHYLADYELSLRVRRSGWRLLVLPSAAVYSDDEYGSMARLSSWREKLLSVRSPLYLPAVIAFWWEASSFLQRLTLPIRMPLFLIFPRLRKST